MCLDWLLKIAAVKDRCWTLFVRRMESSNYSGDK